jgi:hypothetical protein
MGIEVLRPRWTSQRPRRSKSRWGSRWNWMATTWSFTRIGATSFLLQNYYQKEWAENFMMQLLVDDLDDWWERIVSLDLPGKFGVSALKPPTMQPWGLRIAYVVDPSGVLSGTCRSDDRRERMIFND